MTADGPLSMGRARVRGRCVCQRPDDAEAVRKPRTLEQERGGGGDDDGIRRSWDMMLGEPYSMSRAAAVQSWRIRNPWQEE